MNCSITGDLAQVVHLNFAKGETCWASKGSILSIDPEIEWSLKLPGGIGGAARRMLSGEGISLTWFEAKKDNQQVILASNEPGKMIEWDLKDGAVITTRGSFIAAFGSQIDIDVTMAKRPGAAFFGGAGLFLQKISGQGRVIIHGSGDFIDRNIQNNETILVSTGNLAAFAEQVDYDIKSVAGLKKILFSGEGLFMTRLSGSGRVLLQSLKRKADIQKKNAD